MFTRLIIHNMSQKVLFLSTLPSIRVLSGRPCDSPSLLSGWWNPSAGWEEEDDDGCDRLVDVNPPKDAQHMATFIKLLKKNRVFLPTVFRTCMYSHVFCVLHGTRDNITQVRWVFEKRALDICNIERLLLFSSLQQTEITRGDRGNFRAYTQSERWPQR